MLDDVYSQEEAAAIGRQLHERQEHNRAVKQMQQFRKAYAQQKRKK